MSRSSYVYVILPKDSFELLAAFTVKHEMMSWFERNPGLYQWYRLPDGQAYGRTRSGPYDVDSMIKTA